MRSIQHLWLIFAFLPIFVTPLGAATPVTSSEAFRSWQVYKGSVTALAFSPDGKVLASAGSEKVFLWDAHSGKLLRQVVRYVGDMPWVIAFTPDSKRLLCVTFEGKVQLHDLTSGAVSWTRRHKGMVHTMALAPDGEKYAIGSGGPDNFEGVLEIGSMDGKSAWVLHSEDPVESVAFSPDSQVVAAGSWSTITLSRVARLTVMQTLNVPDERISAVAFSADGKLLASMGNDNAVLLWKVENLKSGAPWRTLTGHQAEIDSLAFSSDGRLLASGSPKVENRVLNDTTVRLWDPQNGQEQRTIQIADGPGAIAFSPDSKTLAVGSQNGKIMLYDVEQTTQQAGQ